MLAILNMSKPKKGEVIAFDGECAVYTDDDMQVHRYPLIEIANEDEEAVLFLAEMRKAMREGKSLREFLDGKKEKDDENALGR